MGGAFAWEGHGGLLRGTHLVALCMVCRVEVRELEVRRALGLALAQCGVDKLHHVTGVAIVSCVVRSVHQSIIC